MPSSTTFRRSVVVALAAALLALVFVACRLLIAADGDVSRFVVAGNVFVDADTVEPEIHVFDTAGYDGQFYFRQSVAPLSMTMDPVGGVQLDQELRISRIGYPLVASVASFGQDSLVPWALVGVNMVGLALIAGLGAQIALRRGLSPWNGLLLASTPGLMMALSRDLTEILMITALVGGIVALQSRRWVLAAVAWVAAVLTHEQVIIVIAIYAIHRLIALTRERTWPTDQDLPWIASGVAVVVLQAVVAAQVGVIPLLDSGDASVTVPLVGLLPELAGWVTGDLAKQELLVLPELAMVIVLVVLAFMRRRQLPDDQRWLLGALAASSLLALTLSRNVWVGPAELRQIVVVPTLAWVILLTAGKKLPWWLVASAGCLWGAVAMLRMVAI